MSKYDSLDAKIMGRISHGNVTFSQLCAYQPADAEASLHSKLPWRLIDRRLQALRKAGKIKFSHSEGWTKEMQG